jgi:L-ascorbate metabolism protein UlaG (beta-lactamase superfamily)
MKRRGFISLLVGSFLLSVRGARRVQIRSGSRGTSTRYFIEWFGHSSFLINPEARVKIVTDPNFNVTSGIEADAVTVSNDHFTHNNVGAVGGDPLILRGITLEQTWNPIETRVKYILIVNLPSMRSSDYGQVANSIFIYEMGSLCIAHLSNIGHLLTPKQERLMRRVDVMMTLIDAKLNLGFEDLVRVINQVKPSVVIPMH